MRMSIYDIKQESKEAGGDLHVGQQRQESQQERSPRNAEQGARQAHVRV
jgi:type III secretory pathway component EscU